VGGFDGERSGARSEVIRHNHGYHIRHVRELFDLSGRVAMVTGGAGKGYGHQIAEALAEAGATVVITSRSAQKACDAAGDFTRRGLNVHAACLDLTRPENVEEVAAGVVDRYGRLDVLFNNAACNHLETLETVSIEDWERVLKVNVTGAMLMSRAVAPRMRTQGRGVIVNLSSIYGVASPDPRIYGDFAAPSPLVYGAAKAALIQMTRHMAVQWAPAIRVNCISPGGLLNGQDPRFVENYEAKTPLGRMAGPDDLKGTALFLASDASAWMTGQNLLLDGGWTIW
jgi:NAD(P)-dependent dehydrogenase (short-subunit alcohol dehydrogenase family)